MQSWESDKTLGRHLRTIVTRLDSTYAHVPLLEESAAAKAQLWVKGFITGTQVAAAEWEGYIASEHVCEFLSPILALSLNDYEVYEGIRMTPEMRANTISLLPSIALALYSAVRLEAEIRKTPAQTTKIGRNAPCPCGSGKKHKRCCGSPARDVN